MAAIGDSGGCFLFIEMKHFFLAVLLLLPALVKAQQYAAWVRKDSTWMMIDTTGKVLPEKEWGQEDARLMGTNAAGDSVLSEQVWTIATGPVKKQRYHYVDAVSGKWLTKQSFDLGEPFLSGYAMVMIGDTINAIDRQGNLLLKKPIPYMHAFNDAAAILSDRILVLPPAYDKACNCLSARALYGYVDRDNKFVIQPLLLDADIFVAGRAKASEDAKHYGYLGLDGEWSIEPVYDEAGRFFLLQ